MVLFSARVETQQNPRPRVQSYICEPGHGGIFAAIIFMATFRSCGWGAGNRMGARRLAKAWSTRVASKHRPATYLSGDCMA